MEKVTDEQANWVMVRIPQKTHKKLKMLASVEGCSMGKCIERMIVDAMTKKNLLQIINRRKADG